MIRSIALILLSLIAFSSLPSVHAFKFNLTDQDKNNKTLGVEICNINTQIDFNFKSATTLNAFSSCSGGTCSLSGPQQSTLRFLDSQGQNISFSLDSLKYTSNSMHPQASKALYFKFIHGNNSLYVELPFVSSLTSNPDLINLDNIPSGNALESLKNFISGTSSQLSSFNFLNLKDFGHFYTAANLNSANNLTTILTSSFLYYTSSSQFTSLSFPANQITSQSFNQHITGDKICYGSLINQGIFQTHIRESFPLWTAWLGILLYWLYNILTEASTINCYDKSFEENKWTSWSFYSLFFLGNQEFFTKLSRSTILLVSFSWQACVLACIYGTVYNYNDTIIIWSSIVAWLVSIPFPFLLGYFFMNKIYNTTINKFEIIRKIKELVGKDSSQALEQEVDRCEQSLYGLYYWFYVTSFIIFATSWIVAVHMLVELPRQFYGMHYRWIGSLGIAFVLDNLIYETVMTVIFGNFAFWRVRGHFYNFKLGELNKIISD